ncbi:uncharacterized protein RCC_10043 [Ramularia collo-cygni]|uniref:Uncharacterized protein n=1 Tax=Ramularia collo-cygni TaxID=112498 RepID=A0A2D3VBG8_9PEZI|nr:uncharacterized protein RCC_10043 [Ramularia collo-cygni]CZT24320.1 uncharacterized protein RCC_10043 [Ramularia collo-cygni]
MGLFRRSHDKERKLKSSHEDNKPVPSASVSNGESSHSRNVAEYSTERPNGGSNHAPDVARSEKAEASPHDSGIHSELGRERGYLLRDSSQPVDLTGIVDLSHTEDTGVSITYAPEVTHETRYISTEEVIQEVITREIHNHDIYHRVLPILDYEVLPPRHFIPGEVGEDGGTAGLIEISADQIPISTRGLDIQAAIANAMSNMMPRVQHPVPARQFTARKFEGTEGDYKESITSEGFKRTETWWVHPPTLETDPERTGPTLPFHLHSETRDLDGFRDGVLDRSSDPRQYQILHSDDPSRAGVMKMRFPPPRGASLGKTSVAGVAATTAAAEPVVLPVRLVGRASEGGNKKGDGKKGDGVVGVAM